LRNRGGCINQIDDVVMLNRNFLRCKLVDDFSGFAQQVELDFVESASYLAVGSD